MKPFHRRVASALGGDRLLLKVVQSYIAPEIHRAVSTAITMALRRSIDFDEVARRWPHLQAPMSAPTHDAKMLSQNGEDGIIAWIMQQIGTESCTFLEFGSGDGTESCALLLADVFGWTGVFADADASNYRSIERKYRSNPRVRCLHSMVTTENINDLALMAAADSQLDLLVVDVDSIDAHLFRALTLVRPRVVLIEYNGELPLDSRATVPGNHPGWDGKTDFFGAALGALEEIATNKNYRLIATDLCGVNAFFLRDDLITPAFDLVARRAYNAYMGAGKHWHTNDRDRQWTRADT